MASERSGMAVNKRELTLRELLQQTVHYNANVRRGELSLAPLCMAHWVILYFVDWLDCTIFFVGMFLLSMAHICGHILQLVLYYLNETLQLHYYH